jgi:hypothetical protein
MAISRAFMTTTEKDSPLDGTVESADTTQISDFLSVQSLTNFSAMTGGIAAISAKIRFASMKGCS